MYKILRSILFCFDAEKVHHFSMNALRLLCNFSPVKRMLAKKFRGPNLPSSVFDLPFPNIVGLAAGFDKNAQYLRELQTLGFGSVEIGTVTPLPQEGNPKPRLFRLPRDKALINRMGFNNDGVAVIAERLKAGQNSKFKIQNSKLIIGGNIGKNKLTPNDLAWKDYEICFNALHPYVDYFVVNVSSPNTPGLRELQEKDSLRQILTNLQEQNKKFPFAKPILLKIAPDLNKEQLDDVIDLALEIKLDGLVAANTTLSREHLITQQPPPGSISGGLSGAPLKNRSTEIIKYIYKKTNGDIPLIASGGIFTGADAKEKLDAGASLVQVWTGFIYEGPAIVKNILKYLNHQGPKT